MAELPFHLKTLEPLTGALDIIRFLGSSEDYLADVDQICDTLGLSDRSFSKAIRRLVTKGYVSMEGDLVYRLTDQGQRAVEELGDYQGPRDSDREPSDAFINSRQIARRMVMALPRILVAHRPASVVVGFHASDFDTLHTPVDLVLRLSVVNGKPEKPDDALLKLTDGVAQQAFTVVPDAFTQVRIKVQAFQLGDNPDEITVSGGMYVDVGVTSGENDDDRLIAFGTEVSIAV
jgi:DNA-binding MarR family transcriptional regulator